MWKLNKPKIAYSKNITAPFGAFRRRPRNYYIRKSHYSFLVDPNAAVSTRRRFNGGNAWYQKTRNPISESLLALAPELTDIDHNWYLGRENPF